jgi:hypothetical protein
MIVPLGQMTLAEANKANIAGSCGRAVMRDIKVRRLLDFRSWYWEPGVWGIGYEPTTNTYGYINDPDATNIVFGTNPPRELSSFIVDPLGRRSDNKTPLPSILFGVKDAAGWHYLPRRTLSPTYFATAYATTRSFTNGDEFYWPDDLALEKNTNTTDRPFIPSYGLDNSRSIDYSYLFTVTPASSDRMLPIPQRRFFDVTVVVFFKRNFNLDANGYPEGEWMATVGSISGMPAGTVSPGGGTIALARSTSTKNYAYRVKGDAANGHTISEITNPSMRDGQWVMLWDSNDGRLAWYRVTGINFPDLATETPTITLNGPDWLVSGNEKLIVIDGAIGAYTSTVELDFDPLWKSMY